MNELAHRQVKITDSFWSPRLAVNARQAIFHQWRELEKSGCLANFRYNQLHPTLRAEYDEQRLGGVEVLRAETVDRRLLTFIPYPLWANRGESQMTVWVNV